MFRIYVYTYNHRRDKWTSTLRVGALMLAFSLLLLYMYIYLLYMYIYTAAYRGDG